jgi:hypothetical protein
LLLHQVKEQELMEQLQYREWKLNVDIEATREAYSKIERGSAEECGCQKCLNFVASRKKMYPEEVLILFDRLGVDFRKEVEVYDDGISETGLHFYSGWFHCVGYLENPSSQVMLVEYADTQVHELELEEVGQQFRIGFTENGGLYWTEFEGKPLVQIEFFGEVPWLIGEVESM